MIVFGWRCPVACAADRLIVGLKPIWAVLTRPGLPPIARTTKQHKIIGGNIARLIARDLVRDPMVDLQITGFIICSTDCTFAIKSVNQLVLEVFGPNLSSSFSAGFHFCGIAEPVSGDLSAVSCRYLERLQWNLLFAHIARGARCVIVSILLAQILCRDVAMRQNMVDNGLCAFRGYRPQLREKLRRQIIMLLLSLF